MKILLENDLAVVAVSKTFYKHTCIRLFDWFLFYYPNDTSKQEIVMGILVPMLMDWNSS